MSKMKAYTNPKYGSPDVMELKEMPLPEPKDKEVRVKVKAISLNPASRVAVNDAYALYRFARAGAGLALVPDFLAAADEHAGMVEHVLPDWQVEDIAIYAVWPNNAPKGGLTRILVDHLASPA